jgi:hypothetical protein
VVERQRGRPAISTASRWYFLGDLVGRRVEIGTSLERARPRIRQRIERDALEVL